MASIPVIRSKSTTTSCLTAAIEQVSSTSLVEYPPYKYTAPRIGASTDFSTIVCIIIFHIICTTLLTYTYLRLGNINNCIRTKIISISSTSSCCSSRCGSCIRLNNTCRSSIVYRNSSSRCISSTESYSSTLTTSALLTSNNGGNHRVEHSILIIYSILLRQVRIFGNNIAISIHTLSSYEMRISSKWSTRIVSAISTKHNDLITLL